MELFLLGRTLMKIGEGAIPAEGLPAYSTSTSSVLVVMLDIYAHPDSAVGEIATRTGFPQSHVSASVARLREAGAVVTASDPEDRRRLLVRRSPRQSRRQAVVASAGIGDALAAALGTDDPAVVAEVTEVLESLAARLNPEALARLRGAPAPEASTRPGPAGARRSRRGGGRAAGTAS